MLDMLRELIAHKGYADARLLQTIRANAAAAISVTRPGARASAPHRGEIDAWLIRHPSPPAVVS